MIAILQIFDMYIPSELEPRLIIPILGFAVGLFLLKESRSYLYKSKNQKINCLYKPDNLQQTNLLTIQQNLRVGRILFLASIFLASLSGALAVCFSGNMDAASLIDGKIVKNVKPICMPNAKVYRPAQDEVEK
jgi:hypothetical protein